VQTLQIETILFGKSCHPKSSAREKDRRQSATMRHLKPPFIVEQAKEGTVALRNCHKHSGLGAVPHGPWETRACILDHNITAKHAM
jgi:hypothetical protein